MKRVHEKLLTVAALFPLLSFACSSSNPPPSVTCTNGMIMASEANDYLFTSQINMSTVTVKSMSDLMFNWAGVTKDFLGHTVDPVADLNSIFLLVVDLPIATFEQQLNDDTFSQTDILANPPPLYSPSGGATSGTLFTNFTSGGMPVDATLAGPYLNATTYTPANSTYTLVAQSGTNLGYGIRMLQAFKLDDAATSTTVTLTNSSTMLTYHADFQSLHPTGVPAGTPALSLDWGTMAGKKNALGAPFDLTQVTSAIVGHYTQTPAQLEGQFLDLETVATELYRADIPSGTKLDFTMLMDANGAPFPGVTSDGTWLVGLRCGMCRNPAPWYMTVLVPAAQPCAAP